MEGLTLSPHALVGAPMLVANRTVFYVKDPGAHCYLRLSAAEKAVVDGVGRGDPSSALIAAAAQHGRALTAASIQRLVDALRRRGILVPRHGAAPAEWAGAARAGREARSRIKVKGPLEFYLRLGGPARMADRVARLLQPVPDGVLGGLALAGVAVAAAAVLTHPAAAWRGLVREATGPFTATSVLFLSLLLVASLVHEVSHAVGCRRAGGQASEIGVMFRYCLFAFYCQVDDLAVIPSMRARWATILAGPASHAFAAAPFAALCLASSPADPAYGFCIAFVLVNLGLAALNLLPSLQLDGYLLVSVGWKYPELRQEALAALRCCLPGRRDAAAGRQAQPVQPLLALYGATSLLFTGAAVAGAGATWLMLFYCNPAVYGVPFVLTVGSLLAALVRSQLTRLSRRQAS